MLIRLLDKDTDVRIHDLRHTYASWLLQSRKVSIEGISELTGHASIATTQRYPHLADSQWASVVDALKEQAAPSLPQNDHSTGSDDPAVRRLRRSEG
ncbi:Phage integrase family protein [Pseudonocardia ammonioxydans]|uniref:Phage integrase family protein n=1 Tax=Pseudonocardia ammonioxydans TaxID=260086 RepID=A0A1I5F2H1_PSUAM|nr:tyrosine-type recombinase/integrase [Pseudonocardia ammonioxydans]SFO17806.1 Phage integrase family protein [Pseudonocardia ammonioxydans]